MAVAFLYDPVFLEHDTGFSHPENADRLLSILRHIEPIKDKLLWLSPQAATHDLIAEIHSEDQIEMVELSSRVSQQIDADTQTSPDSFDAAAIAVGTGVTAVDALLKDKISSAFAAVRPPGHHATAHQSMGFCLFNNIAITARYAQEMGFEKILIVDFDVHHGNGTQDIFYDDPTVFYFSTHQYPAYPGSGSNGERGRGEGEGFTLNFPMQPGSGDDDLLPIYEEELPRVVEAFKPDLILVSAGYDLHAADPLASLNVTTEGIAEIVSLIMESSNVPKLFFLEGGYDLEALGASVKRTLEVMLAFDADFLQ